MRLPVRVVLNLYGGVSMILIAEELSSAIAAFVLSDTNSPWLNLAVGQAALPFETRYNSACSK